MTEREAWLDDYAASIEALPDPPPHIDLKDPQTRATLLRLILGTPQAGRPSVHTGTETTGRLPPASVPVAPQAPGFPKFRPPYPHDLRAAAGAALWRYLDTCQRPEVEDHENALQRFQTGAILEALDQGGEKEKQQAAKIRACCTESGVSAHKQDPTRAAFFWYHCRERMCPRCQKIRALKWRRRLLPLLQDCWLRQERVRFLTITQRDLDGETCGQALRRMQALFLRFRKTRGFRKHVTAWARFVEVTFTEKGRWHAHIHMLTTGSYWKQADVRALLGLLQQEEFGICDIRQSRTAVLDEVIKYPLKPLSLNNMGHEEIRGYAKGSRGLRFVSTGGRWAKLPKEEKDPDFWTGDLSELIRLAHEGQAWAIYSLDHLARSATESVPQVLYKTELLPETETRPPPTQNLALDF